MTGSVTLFHGSNQDFNRVNLAKSRDKRDFGRGFYMTTLKEQAAQWAENMFIRHGGKGGFVYEFTFAISEALHVKRFDGICAEWLETVRINRVNGGIQHSYDVVWGPVADDNTMRTLALFIAGIYTEEIALSKLSFFKANDQVSIHTESALSNLVLVRKENEYSGE